LTWATPELPAEITRRHPNYCEVRSIHANSLTDKQGRAILARLPQTVAQPHLVVSSECFLFPKKRAAQNRLHTQHLEVARENAQSGNLPRLLLGARRPKIVASPSGMENVQGFEGTTLPFEIPEVRRRDDIQVVRPFADLRTPASGGQDQGKATAIALKAQLSIICYMPDICRSIRESVALVTCRSKLNVRARSDLMTGSVVLYCSLRKYV
jgi:hypothetical protein